MYGNFISLWLLFDIILMVIKMKYKIDNNSLIICPNNIKNDILMELSQNKILLNIKFMDMIDFKREYYGTYKNDAIYFLLKHFNINYDVAREYLDNIFYGYNKLNDIYNDLKENDLLVFNNLFKTELKQRKIIVIGYNDIDKCIKDELLKYNADFRCELNQCYQHDAYEFVNIDDEVNFVANDIISKLKDNNLSNFCLINIDDSYTNVVKRIFGMYNLPINFNNGKKIFGTITVQKFINKLIETRNIEM